MNVKEMADIIKKYEMEKANINIYRYTNTVKLIEAHPDVFGMNFEKIIPAPLERQADIFLMQEERADILRNIMSGITVDDERMQKAFGFDNKALEECIKDNNPIIKEIPDNICVLCFDDAIRSQYEIALPILEEFGFGATFFVAEKGKSPMDDGFEDKSIYMTWDEIKDIDKRGFEIGNHSLSHTRGSHEMGREFNIKEILGMEEEFKKHGISKPVSYAYPSGICNPEVLNCARECGYLWARGNEEKGKEGIRGMTYYNPCVDSPLAICNFGDPDFYTEDLLKKRIKETPAGMIFGLTYHGISAQEWAGPITFRRHMEVLKELDMKVIAVKDLGNYIDSEKAYNYTSC